MIPFAGMSPEATNPWRSLNDDAGASWWKIHEPGKIENAEGKMLAGSIE